MEKILEKPYMFINSQLFFAISPKKFPKPPGLIPLSWLWCGRTKLSSEATPKNPGPWQKSHVFWPEIEGNVLKSIRKKIWRGFLFMFMRLRNEDGEKSWHVKCFKCFKSGQRRSGDFKILKAVRKPIGITPQVIGKTKGYPHEFVQSQLV